MRNLIFTGGTAFYLCVLTATSSAAATCDAALVKTAYSSMTATHDDWRLSLLINSENYEQAKHDAGVNAVIYGIPVGATYSDYSENRARIFQQHNESRTVNEMRNVAWTALDPNAESAYSDCLRVEALNQNGLQAVVWSATASDITIVVRWFLPGQPAAARVTWTPHEIEGIAFPRAIPQGTTAIVIPRPKQQESFVGNYRGYSTIPIVLGPLPPSLPPAPTCTKTTVTIPAKDYDPTNSKNLQIGVIYGADLVHNAPPYGHAENLAQYQVYFPCAGRYLIRIEYAAGESRPVELSLRNNAGYNFSRTVAERVTGTWTIPVFTDEGTADIPAGQLTMVLYRPDYFPHLRTIQFEPVN